MAMGKHKLMPLACNAGQSIDLSSLWHAGPTFRAENSMTTRHLAEFWMIEPELAFADLSVVNECAEGYVRFCIRYILDHCAEDLVFFEQQYEKGLLDRLQVTLSSSSCRSQSFEHLGLLA